jgi:ABC-type transport system involved in multi-copper enzyme maturation permease subunit
MKDRQSIRSFFRIIWAIALKDIVDAIKNKTVLSVLGSVVFTVAMYKYLPYLDGKNELPGLLLYDAGNSALAVQLEESPNFRLYSIDTQAGLERAITRADRNELGLAFPADMEQRLLAGENVQLEGFVAYWIDEEQAEELRQLVEAELAYYTGASPAAGLRIDGDLTRLHPQNPGVAGSGFMVSMAIVLVLTMLGVLVVVHLMVEEKQARTLDVMMVSPASALQMLIGKATTGLVYSMVGVVAVYVLNAAYITNWGMALGAGLCGALFTVGLGLWLGAIFESRQQLTLWGFLLMNVLLLPMFLVIMDDLLPSAAIEGMQWVPTSAVAWLVRASFLPRPPMGPTFVRLGYVLAWAALVFVLGVWRMRRLDR